MTRSNTAGRDAAALESREHSRSDPLLPVPRGLRLVLHERKTVVAPTAGGVPFLGFVLFPDGRRRLTRDGVRRFRGRLRRLARELEAGVIRPEDVNRSVRGWIAHAEHAQTLRLRREVFKEVTFRCRPPSS